VWFLFEQQEIMTPQKICGTKSARSAADDNDVVFLRNRRPSKALAVANLMAYFEVVTIDPRFRHGISREKR
jgi:hypothetical protein